MPVDTSYLIPPYKCIVRDWEEKGLEGPHKKYFKRVWKVWGNPSVSMTKQQRKQNPLSALCIRCMTGTILQSFVTMRTVIRNHSLFSVGCIWTVGSEMAFSRAVAGTEQLQEKKLLCFSSTRAMQFKNKIFTRVTNSTLNFT